VEKFFKHPWIIVGVIAAITVFFAAQLPRARMDNNLTSFLPETHEAKVTARHFEEEYGDSISVMVGLERPYGTVFETEFLGRVREFSEAVEEIPLVKSVTSIMSTQYITSDSESIIVTDLVDEDFSGTPEEIAALKSRIASWDLYQGALISDDAAATEIVVTLDATSDHAGDDDVMAVLKEIRAMAKEAFAGYAEVYTAGQSVVSLTLTESAYADLWFLIPLTIVMLLGVLTLSFRRFSYVTLPLLTVMIAVIWSVGAMPLFGVTLTLLSIMMPVILMAVGSAYGIHVISHYKDEVAGNTATVEGHRAAVLGLAKRLLKPVFLAALTTFAGFVSFCFAPLSSMRSFGVFASFGVIVAFVTAVTLVPAILLIRGPRAARLAKQSKSTPKDARARGFNFDKELSETLTGIARKKALVVVATAVVVAVSVWGATKLVVDSSMVEFFNPATEVNRSDRFVRENFGGSTQFIVSVEADSTEVLLSPETLGALDGLCTYLVERVPNVGKVTGFTDLVKRMNQMFNVDEPPEGVRVTQASTDDSDDEFGFGFGDFGDDTADDAFGFGGFGFDEETDAAAEAEPVEVVAAADLPAEGTSPAASETTLTFGMLNAAAGKHAGMTANELVRELERQTNYEGYAYYEIPTDPAKYGKTTSAELQRLVSNYLVLLAGDSDDSFSNDPLEPTAIETVVLVNSQWNRDAQAVIDAINGYVAANFPRDVRVLVGGGATQEMAIAGMVTSSQISSLLIAVLVVIVIIAASNKSLAAGFIAALPLSIAILANFALMGFLGITLNMGTALMASLAVGIGIDYTIHFIDAFRREYAAGGAYLERAFATSGKAILINAVSVGASFGVLMFSQFRIVAQFGTLVCFSMMVSAVVSLTVIPVVLEIVKPRFIFGKPSAPR